VSLIFNMFMKLYWLNNFKYTRRLWKYWWAISRRYFLCSVTTKVHDYKVILNYGHLYPVVAREFNTFNNPLIELVYQNYVTKQRPITVIDVGAGIGDTMLMLYANCCGMIKNFYCIDGDPSFFKYLQYNLRHLTSGKLFLAVLSSHNGKERELIQTHPGTASSQGHRYVKAWTLDSILLESSPGNNMVDVLKIDVDGFDGKVLLGARKVLQTYRPCVIFEWYPAICKETKNNWTDHFEVLIEMQYTKFIWFNRFGEFSHFMVGYDPESINIFADFCLNSRHYFNCHYDIIALHKDSLISHFSLAELLFAKDRKSVY